MGFTLEIYNELNIKCFETKIVSLSNAFDPLTPRCKFTCQLPELALLPDLYYINIGLYPLIVTTPMIITGGRTQYLS